MITSRGDPHHPAQRVARSIHHLHRVASIRGGTVPQLTDKIITHRPDRAVPFQIHRVKISRGDPHHPAQRIARSVQHLHRVFSFGRGTVTKLTIRIATRRPDRAIPLQIHRVSISLGDPHHPAQRVARNVHHLHRVGSIGLGAVTQLTIIAPRRPDRAVPFQIHRVDMSRRSGLDRNLRKRSPIVQNLHGVYSSSGVPITPVHQKYSNPPPIVPSLLNRPYSTSSVDPYDPAKRIA